MSIYQRKTNAARKPMVLDMLVEKAATALSAIKGSVNTGSVARAALAMESISSADSEQLSMAVDQLSNAVESIATDLTHQVHAKSSIYTTAQRDAAAIAGLMVGNIEGSLAAPVAREMLATENMSVIGTSGLNDSFDKRTLAVEAYDERENRKAAQYTVAYNMQASRQDEFGEAFFPTIAITPDNVGFSVQARIVSVFNDFKRSISGDLSQYQKRNIIRAAIDHTILKNELTNVVPVHRAESVNKFVAPADAAPIFVDLDGESIKTAPLAIGKSLNLIALSQTDTLLANGVMDPSDSLDPSVTLKNLYVKIGADILSFKTLNLPLSVFSPAVQGNYRQMNLAFVTTSLLMNKNTKQLDGSALVDTAAIVTSDYIVRLGVRVSGDVNLETGDMNVFSAGVELVSVQDNTGTTLSLTAGAPAALAALVADATVFGYDVQAYRSNMNRRQRGQLLDTTFYTQLYPVPLRSPITALRPVTTDGQTDSSDLAALITATQLRASNEAVGTLLDAAVVLNEYVDNRAASVTTVAPDILGVSRLLVVPAFHKSELDMSLVINSISSHQRAADMQAVLVNAIRDAAYRLYRDSGYQPAANAMAGGQAAAPTVIIGTDPVLARYLMVDGDLRTLGSELNCKLVSTNDSRMAGKIVFSFGQFDGGSENAVNPLHFGNMAWKPEFTLVLPISRGGQTSKELTVQPSFRHVVHLPVMGIINVLNVPNVASSKVSIDFHSV